MIEDTKKHTRDESIKHYKEIVEQRKTETQTYVIRHKDEPVLEYCAFSNELQKMLIMDQGSKMILIPIKLNVTLFGLSGFYVGNIVTTDILPEAYQANCAFQIIGISDTINTSGWKTELTGMFRFTPRKSSTEFPETQDAKIQKSDIYVAQNIKTKGNPDDLQNTCFGKYKIADLNMNKFGLQNDITFDVKQNLIYLCREFLKPLNNSLKNINIELSVVSAFRSNEINSRYNEPIDNMHTFGCAADLKARNILTGDYLTPNELAQLIWMQNLTYDIMVIEDYWLHIAYVNETAAGRKNRKLQYKEVVSNNTRTAVPISKTG